MAFNPNQVVLDGYTQHDFAFTMFLAAGHGLTDDELIGRAVSLDTSADATVKVVDTDEAIYGRIFQVEDRSQEGVVTVTVETRFRKRLKKASGTVMARGDTAVGDGDGLVKSAAADDPAKNVVLSVASEYVIVEQ
jgi:hypothetical protein